MAIIRVVGQVVVFDFHNEEATEDDTPVVENPAIVETLDGLQHNEIFSDYLSDGGDKTLTDAGVTGGLLRFEFNKKNKQLNGVIEYSAPRLLTASELELLKEYTMGQWSDGIGSNFFQSRMSHGLAPQLQFFNKNDVLIEQRS